MYLFEKSTVIIINKLRRGKMITFFDLLFQNHFNLPEITFSDEKKN